MNLKRLRVLVEGEFYACDFERECFFKVCVLGVLFVLFIF